ncbi:MAG: hypothetical protein JWN66_3259 [Sphingomonas bacterium]|uniref:lasso peptide biosynthesis B2 protein n=1 Tax=Sphingomonas bacterium TaxID=1895847 RepID=UPI002615E2EB|nr:lasso peptide biosynthesis B2 protein [Sphingomonas bacterium]MDB5706143.1 hypothetical protein [Sphingomonas bacterium]
MGYALRHGLAFCLIQDRPIFLDVTADRYFALEGESARALLSLARRSRAPASPEGLDLLLAQHLLRPIESTTEIVPCGHPPAARSLIDLAPAGIRSAGLPRILFALGSTSIRLGTCGLAAVLATIGARKAQLDAPPATIGPLKDLALRYHRSRGLSMPLDRCLVRAVALAMDAVRAGYGVTLVFGVQLRPFGAHCWVEHDGEILDDGVDHVRRFTPVLAL